MLRASQADPVMLRASLADPPKSREMDYFSIKICFFYIWHKTCRFLLEQLCEHVSCQDIQEIFFFVSFNMFKMHFK
jgi:hypothetical protein